MKQRGWIQFRDVNWSDRINNILLIFLYMLNPIRSNTDQDIVIPYPTHTDQGWPYPPYKLVYRIHKA